MFTGHPSLEEAQKFYQDVKVRAKSFGRNPNEILILPGIGPIIGHTEEEASKISEEIANLVTIEKALAYLGEFLEHHDFSNINLTKAFPELGDLGSNSFKSGTDWIKQEAKEKNLTLRQVAISSATPRTPFIGTPEQVADRITKIV